MYKNTSFFSSIKKKMDGLEQKDSNLPLSIEHVQKGGVFHLLNIGSDLQEFDCKVIGKHDYEQDGYHWTELEADKGDGVVWLTIDKDDKLDLSIALEKISLQALGFTNSDDFFSLIRSGKGDLKFKGKTYYFSESGKATFFRNGDRNNPAPFEYFEYESEDEESCISVELWGKMDFDIHYSDYINESQVSVYSLSEGDAL